MTCALLFCAVSLEAKVHIISFSPWQKVKLVTGENEDRSWEMWVRTLSVDGRAREFTVGEMHEITDRVFVVRRAYRVNDALPSERGKQMWRWQRGGWLIVDRFTGGIKPLTLADFDPFYSTATWFRDYVAYCGVSEAGDHVYAMVVQVGRRKPLVKKPLGAALVGEAPDSECDAPEWQRHPLRVTFAPHAKEKVAFAVRPRMAENPADEVAEEGGEE